MNKDSLLTLALIVIGLSVLVFIGTGCSTDNISAGPTATEMSDAQKTAYESMTRPEVVLPEGLELVTGMSGKMAIDTDGALDDPTRGGSGGSTGSIRPPVPENDEPCVSVYVAANSAANVQCMFTGVNIPVGAVPHDMVVTACMPDEETAIVDFGPHPLEFNGVVQIWFDISNVSYTNDEFASLQIWYVTDEGDLEELPTVVDRGNMRVMGRTDHFSRYILTKTTTTTY